jgi:nitroimidazol reductase NimA-like FMN-containing flavoprotein (pyridoxamine 5'-phosphate oxidase superfamily)
MARIPDNYLDLLNQKKAFASLATIMANGSPQVTPVWFDYYGGNIRVNTAKGRVKSRTLKPGAPVALAVTDPDNPYALRPDPRPRLARDRSWCGRAYRCVG